jgi:chromosome segregation protein
LQKNLPKLQQSLQQVNEALTAAEANIHALRQQQQQENVQLKTATSSAYQQQLELARLQQAQQTALEREASIKAEIEAANSKLTQLSSDEASKQAALQAVSAQLASLEAAKNNDFSAKQQAEQVYAASRDTIQLAEKSYQEVFYSVKFLVNNINELNNKINVNSEEKTAFLKRQTEAEDSLKLTPMETLKTNLSAALDAKQLRETALAEARNHLAVAETLLQELERVRMHNEQQLHPMRDSVEQSRLNEQESRLHFEQCQAGLAENGQSEEVLSVDLADNTKTSDLLRKTNSLQQQIESLGAVNLAAIQELATETERKTYLDSQMLDLTQATETLEDAIKKIDRETRDKLMQTFNTVNTHFNELFATLFGGGQAKLELLGDEILDTGLQVFAQPPGKKNTTIQLLSGGEKALTAIALVFALFRLNPAPFCLMDEVDAPLDDSNTERFCNMVKKMSEKTQFLFVSHNKITMEMAQQLIGVTMQESGVSRIVDVDIDAALNMQA